MFRVIMLSFFSSWTIQKTQLIIEISLVVAFALLLQPCCSGPCEIQNGGRGRPWFMLQNYSTNYGVA